MPMQVMVDDSGYGITQSPAFVMAGLIASAEHWATLSDRWRECLDEPPAIAYLKMYEAAGRKEQFSNWRASAVEKKVRSLVSILIDAAPTVLMITVDHAATVSIKEPGSDREFIISPYMQAYHGFIMAAAHELADQGVTERFEIFFDEQPSQGQKAKRWYPVMRLLAAKDIRPILPLEPHFQDDIDFLPLQAADIIAWHTRRYVSTDDTRFDWLLEALGKLPVSRYRRHITSADYRRLLAMGKDPNGAPIDYDEDAVRAAIEDLRGYRE